MKPPSYMNQYIIHKSTAWMCIGLTFCAGISTGFAIACLVLL